MVLGFLVSRFFGCLVFDFLVSFLVARIYQISISCFWTDIDLISEILEISLRVSSGFSVPFFSKIVNCLGFQNSSIYAKNIF